jgi:hypothetical protein
MKTGKSFSVLPKTALRMLTDATSNAGRDGLERTFSVHDFSENYPSPTCSLFTTSAQVPTHAGTDLLDIACHTQIRRGSSPAWPHRGKTPGSNTVTSSIDLTP